MCSVLYDIHMTTATITIKHIDRRDFAKIIPELKRRGATFDGYTKTWTLTWRSEAPACSEAVYAHRLADMYTADQISVTIEDDES
jgi:hypothetical protein